MTHEKFTGVTFNHLDLSGTRISRSSEFSVVVAQKLRLYIYTTQTAYLMNRETTDKIIVYARNTESG